ncbi:MAG TPA: glycosyl hydrolase family 65 protein [Microthrixaceae bacterium]|nr:glycosyl hydrolase family 65 protein [Microthrixaceae bacterium]
MNPWLLVYEGFEPEQEGLREALCTLGNGYFATRGALPESQCDGVHYPGTYMAGLFNRLSSTIADREVESEGMVNVPNWLSFRFKLTIDGKTGPWITSTSADPVEHRIELDMHRGLLIRITRFDLGAGRILRVTQRRLVSMSEPHLAALETTFVTEGFNATIIVESALDGTVSNSGIARYNDLPSNHLNPESTHIEGNSSVCLTVATNQSKVRIAMAARTSVRNDAGLLDHTVQYEQRSGWVASTHTVGIQSGSGVTFTKVVAVFTGRDSAISEPALEACSLIDSEGRSFAEILSDHVLSWRHLWDEIDLDLGRTNEGTLSILHLHMFHILTTVSHHSALLDVGVPARGLHGEAYRGHIFWDELFIFPFFSLRLPELTRSLLLYRYRRLGRAKRDARASGYQGAMYPWQSSSDGREETQTIHLNPRSGRWLRDASHLQRHVNAAIAYNIWHYHQATADEEFLRSYSSEMLIEIARFWASIATYDHSLDRYRICGVMGPDEYHEGYPGSDEPGLNDNAYTNVMAAWCLRTALEVLDHLSPTVNLELIERLAITSDEIDRWDHVSRKIRIPFLEPPDGSGPVINQFDGYETLAELDLDAYRERYGDISRMDRILEAEGDSPNNYKICKQADVTMLFFLLTAEELGLLFERLGYEWDPEIIPRTIAYYETRTSHGSTLSLVVDSWIHARADRARSWDDFQAALHSDVNDVQGGTTSEGIHLGAMAGTIDLIQRCYSGIELKNDALYLNPAIPEQLDNLALNLRYRGNTVSLRVSKNSVEVRLAEGLGAAICVRLGEDVRSLSPGDQTVFSLPQPKPAIRTFDPAEAP